LAPSDDETHRWFRVENRSTEWGVTDMGAVVWSRENDGIPQQPLSLVHVWAEILPDLSCVPPPDEFGSIRDYVWECVDFWSDPQPEGNDDEETMRMAGVLRNAYACSPLFGRYFSVGGVMGDDVEIQGPIFASEGEWRSYVQVQRPHQQSVSSRFRAERGWQ